MSKKTVNPLAYNKRKPDGLQSCKFIRQKKVFKANKPGPKNLFDLRLCSSHSPRTQVAGEFLDGIELWCDDAHKKLNFVRQNIVSLTLKIGKLQPCLDDFQERRDDLINQCQGFVHERKFALKSQQELLGTKKLHKMVTKRMLGD